MSELIEMPFAVWSLGTQETMHLHQMRVHVIEYDGSVLAAAAMRLMPPLLGRLVAFNGRSSVSGDQ